MDWFLYNRDLRHERVKFQQHFQEKVFLKLHIIARITWSPKKLCPEKLEILEIIRNLPTTVFNFTTMEVC